MLFTEDWTSETTTATKLTPSHLLRTSLEMGFTLVSTYQFLVCFSSTFIIVSCIRVFCLHICKCTMYVQCPRRLEEGIGSPEIGVRQLWAHGCWELSRHPLQGQQVCLTVETPWNILLVLFLFVACLLACFLWPWLIAPALFYVSSYTKA